MGARAFRFRASDGVELPYVVHVPHGAAPGTGWPLVLFLHGAAERGSDPERLLRVGLPAEVARRPAFPAVLIAPQCPPRTTWLEHEGALLELLDESQRAWRVDPRRVHLTGLSMGGMGAWMLGARAPERFASVVPVCGSVPARPGFPAAVRALRRVPVWAFHGALDPVVPVRHTLVLVQALREAGGHPRLTVFSDVGHRAWEPAYAEAELQRWFTGPLRAPSRAG